MLATGGVRRAQKTASCRVLPGRPAYERSALRTDAILGAFQRFFPTTPGTFADTAFEAPQHLLDGSSKWTCDRQGACGVS
jgi:hypothetical protein